MKKQTSQKEAKRRDWEYNHEKIISTHLRLYLETGKLPTQEKLAEACQLSRGAIQDHLKDLRLPESTVPFRTQTHQVLEGLTERAKKGNAVDVKLWLQIVHGWKEVIATQGFTGTVDLKKLTKEQLKRIADGEDIASVLADQKP